MRFCRVCVLILLCCVHSLAIGQVLLVLSDTQGAPQEFSTAFESALAVGSDPAIERTTAEAFQGGNGHQLIVTVGAQAARSVVAYHGHTPVLHTLISRSTWESLESEPDKPAIQSAVLLDQPISRQLNLIRHGLPTLGRIALLSGPDSRQVAAQIAKSAREQGFAVASEQVTGSNGLYPALERALAEPAAILALADPAVFNPYSIQNILLTAYRRHSPLIGLSAAYVRAGAVLAVYSTPAQIGRQAAEIARRALGGAALPPAQPPRYFEVGSNQQVARSMGLAIPSTDRLQTMLQSAEGNTP